MEELSLKDARKLHAEEEWEFVPCPKCGGPNNYLVFGGRKKRYMLLANGDACGMRDCEPLDFDLGLMQRKDYRCTCCGDKVASTKLEALNFLHALGKRIMPDEASEPGD